MDDLRLGSPNLGPPPCLWYVYSAGSSRGHKNKSVRVERACNVVGPISGTYLSPFGCTTSATEQRADADGDMVAQRGCGQSFLDDKPATRPHQRSREVRILMCILQEREPTLWPNVTINKQTEEVGCEAAVSVPLVNVDREARTTGLWVRSERLRKLMMNCWLSTQITPYSAPIPSVAGSPWLPKPISRASDTPLPTVNTVPLIESCPCQSFQTLPWPDFFGIALQARQ
ncbi:hypothetical protein F5Y15DRAFT_21673 [Xylariaceae sp. FL0016]|nr:hypothetical protein F5Y15DRAFT_21673 [Xylariaceae sp. FL0016]